MAKNTGSLIFGVLLGAAAAGVAYLGYRKYQELKDEYEYGHCDCCDDDCDCCCGDDCDCDDCCCEDDDCDCCCCEDCSDGYISADGSEENSDGKDGE